MSFKLSELLNPAPPSEPSSKPSHSHSPPSHVARSPESYSASYPHSSAQQGYGNGSSYSAQYAQAVTSSFEAASALTALATSGTSSTSHYSPTHSSHDHFVLSTLPPLSSLPPLPNTTARRTSYSTLPRFSDRATFPSPTNTLEQYRSSKSPDELRRQSYPIFEPAAAVAIDTFTRGQAGPVLAPIHHTIHTSVAPLDQDSSKSPPDAFDLAKSTSCPAENNSLHHITSPHPSHTTAMMDEGESTMAAIQQPAPTQIREPSAAAPEAKMTPQAPEPAERQPLDAGRSPGPKIKHEPTGTPMEGTPVKDGLVTRESTQVDGDMDEDTLKAIEAAKNDFGLRTARQKAQPSIEEPPPTVEENKSKKRPAPKVKKGQATVKKPPSKRRKVDDNASTTTRRSLSPSRASKLSTAQRATSGAGKKSKSNTPALGSSPAPGSIISGDESYASDASSSGSHSNDVFCICRKGDNHTWMIACDGGCEDWFHGKCVNILEEDGELIDKYICPNCEKTTAKVTTWLPGCRNRGCRKPARIRKGNMSKYCSDRCGREFMEEELRRSEEARRKASGKDNVASKNKRKGITTAEVNGQGDSDDDLGPRGGALKASELKALAASANGDISAFRNLGTGVLSPPATISPTAERFPSDTTTNTALELNATEEERIEAISKEKDDLRRRRTLLKDREKFGQLVRENVAKYAEREKIKPKDVCGYDNRLTWSEEEFSIWRESDEGKAALADGTLGLPEPKDKPEMNGAGGEKMDVDGEAPADSKATGAVRKATICTKKRCERHRQWQKQALADVRFEESQLADRMRSLEAEEREIREAALLRSRMEASGLGGEGVVEVVAG